MMQDLPERGQEHTPDASALPCATVDTDRCIEFGQHQDRGVHNNTRLGNVQPAHALFDHLSLPSAEPPHSSRLRGYSEELQPTEISWLAHQLQHDQRLKEHFFADLGCGLSNSGAIDSLSSGSVLPEHPPAHLSKQRRSCATTSTATSTLSTLTASEETTAQQLQPSIASLLTPGAAVQIDARSPQTCPGKARISQAMSTTKPETAFSTPASAMFSLSASTTSSKRPPPPSFSSQPRLLMDSLSYNDTNDTPRFTLETTYTMVYPSPPLQPVDSNPASLHIETSSLQLPPHTHKPSSGSCPEGTDKEASSTPPLSSTPSSDSTTPFSTSPSESLAPIERYQLQDGPVPAKTAALPLQLKSPRTGQHLLTPLHHQLKASMHPSHLHHRCTNFRGSVGTSQSHRLQKTDQAPMTISSMPLPILGHQRPMSGLVPQVRITKRTSITPIIPINTINITIRRHLFPWLTTVQE
ncbi:hypothetical protein B0O80DRAFT_205693 [Mortierella sp. GBAus27b]|nr:hypothetical protein B0O80DRAFT_205693 [Mortierella sp. GBAus27b]